MTMFKKLALIALSALLAFSLSACDNKKPSNTGGGEKPVEPDANQLEVNYLLENLSAEEFTNAQLTGVDALGRRVLPTAGSNGKYVGLFYFVLLGDIGHNRIIDVNDLMEKYGTDLVGNPLFAVSGNPGYGDESPTTQFHYWGKPLYGYYQSSDRWVVRRHLELFMNAGIDFLYLDYTNSTYEYDAGVRALCDVILELLSEGYENVPRLAFMLPDNANDSANKLQSIYNKWYSKNEFAACWFRGDSNINPTGNKPMVVGNFTATATAQKNILDTLSSRLWLKQMQWPSRAADDDSFPWIEWNKDSESQPNHGGIMNVSIAQHANSWSSSSWYADKTGGTRSSSKTLYRARGWDPAEPSVYGTDSEKVLAGTNFEWQWQNALAAKDDLYMVTVTGWNEWCAPKVDSYGYTVGGVKYGVFNDCFNMEFSRDAEMMEGGYGDNYYMQLVRNIRAFKGVSVAESDNIMLFDKSSASGADDADSLEAGFIDMKGDCVARTASSVGNVYDYSDDSNRNNIVETRVGNDSQNLYIAVKCKDDVTAPENSDAAWMNVYLSLPDGTNWEGFSFVIGRERDGSSASIEKFDGNGSNTVKLDSSASFVRGGKTVLYTVPLSALGLKTLDTVGVKATDNIKRFGIVDDFYISGDCAPMGRLSYAYKVA